MHDPKEFTDDMKAQFEVANPNIKLEIIKTDMTRFYAMAAAGNPPDVVRVQAPDLPQLRDPDNLCYFREEVGGLCMGGYERDPAPWGLDGIPPERVGQLHLAGHADDRLG